MLRGISWRWTTLFFRYQTYTCTADLLACRNLTTHRYILCERKNKHPQKYSATSYDVSERRQAGNLTYEQTIADALDAFNSTSDSMQGSCFIEMSDTVDVGAKSTKYEETLMEAVGAFSENSAPLHTSESLHEKQESAVGTDLDTEHAHCDQSFRIALDAFNSNLNYETSSVLLLNMNKFPETKNLTAKEFELQKALRSVVKVTQFTLSIHAFALRKPYKIKRLSKGSFRVLNPNSSEHTTSDSFLEGNETTKVRVLSKFKKNKSRPDEILQKMLSVEERKMLKQMIRTEVQKQLNVHQPQSKGDSKNERNHYERDTKKQENIDKLSQVILENLMAQMLKNALLNQKLIQLFDWIKQKENQWKVLKKILRFIVFILRFKFVVIPFLPEAVSNLTSVDMFSSFKVDNDLKATITTSSMLDLGKHFDGKSVSITSTTKTKVDGS